MSSIYLPPEILDLIVKETDKGSLPSFSSVSREWSWPAKKKIWSRIEVPNKKVGLLLQVLESNKELGTYVKYLTTYYHSPPPPRQDSSEELEKMKMKDLGRVLEYLTNLSDLLIYDNVIDYAHLNFKREIQISVNLTHLSSFAYFVGDYDTSEILRTVLSQAINLSNLTLYIDSISPNFIPIQQCSSLTRLSLVVKSSSVDILQPQQSLLPFSALNNLTQFYYRQTESFNPLGPIALLKQNTFTLEVLDLEFSNEELLEQSGFFSIISTLTKLRTFSMSDYSIALPLDIFHLLPSTIKFIDIPLALSHFKHLRLHPRPNLQLKDISLAEIDLPADEDLLELFKLLPNHLESVSFGEINPLALIHLLNNVEEVTKVTRVRKVKIQAVFINVDEENDEEENDEDDIPEEMRDLEYFISRFREVGIELDIYDWQLSEEYFPGIY